ncbi:phosphoribosylamine--glycine ligase [Bdellovibrionota bacterium FG-2]
MSANPAGAKVVVVGAGAREHALAWKLSASPQVSQVIVAPGNDGLPSKFQRWELGSYDLFAKRCVQEAIDLVVIGPDNPLADGIVDILEAHGVLAFGPTRKAAQIESSKIFAKEVMRAAGIPTGLYKVCETAEQAQREVEEGDWPNGLVVKAEGLAFGKGVQVCETRKQALAAVSELALISPRLLIEERLSGEEVSWMAFCEGAACALLEPARDYKRLREGDEGPNTGGMGALSPVPGIAPHWAARIRREVFEPVLTELKKRGCEFKGVLYAGLMVDCTQERFWVLEFNARFGDPEAQVLLPRIQGDFYEWCRAVALGNLAKLPCDVPFSKEAAVTVVAAAPGYPQAPKGGILIHGFEGVAHFFSAAIRKDGDRYLTNGGRIFSTLGMGRDLGEARKQAYAQFSQVHFEGMQIRSDIAQKESLLFSRTPRIAIFASGRGSNFTAILNSIRKGELAAQICVVFSDQREAPVIELARSEGIPVSCVPFVEFGRARRREFEERVIEEVTSFKPDFIVFAGFMRLVSRFFIDAFRSSKGYSRIVNIHPSLLPSFPGSKAYAQAFEHGVKVTGVSVHLVEEQMDEGPILAQEAFDISDLKTLDEVEKRGLAIEHRLYPEILSWVLQEQFHLENLAPGGRTRVLQD